MKLLILAVILSLVLIPSVFAHHIGNEVEREVDGFIFEFGSHQLKPTTSEKNIMTFSFYNSTKTPLETDNLWIRISKGNTIFFSSTDFSFKTNGPVTLTYLFTKPGNYTIDLSTKDENKTLKTSFPVEVVEEQSFFIYILPFVFILIIISIIILWRRR